MNITGRPDIYEKMVSPSGFLPYFKDGLESWKSWCVFFKVLAGTTIAKGRPVRLVSCLPRER